MFSALQTKTISAKTGTKNSAFKTLVFEMLKVNGDFSKLLPQIRNSTIKCWVKQTYPRFLISDGTFYIQAYFTSEAFGKCHQGKQVNINITDLLEGLIAISNWECELVTTNSAEEFTSYGGVEMRLIIHDFKVKLGEHIKMSKYPANLYRDDDIKAYMLHFIEKQRLEKLV